MISTIKRLWTGHSPETPLEKLQRQYETMQGHNVNLHFKLAAANKRAVEAEAKLDAIKQQRSENTRRGNATRKAKREAAALIVRGRASG